VTIRRAVACFALAGLLVVRAAAADHVTVTLTVSGTAGTDPWYRTAVTVTFTVAPPEAVTSGNCPTSGTTSVTLTSDTNPVSLTCTATVGSHSASGSIAIGVDTIAPAVTSAAPTRGADGADWYNHPIAVAYAGTDERSGIAGCDVLTYSGPDSASASVAGGKCRDVAGNESAPGPAVGLKYDASPPAVTGASAGRSPDAGDWYNRPVEVVFAGSDGLSGLASCSGATYSGPDGASASVSGSCRDHAGNSAGGAFTLSYDATPPELTGATPGRPADANGWYNHPVAFKVAASDGASGVEDCNDPTYRGPDGAGASVSASCRDKAGNQAVKTFSLKYDETPPEVTGAKADRPPDGGGWYNHPVTFAFEGRDALSGLDACTTVAFDGPQGERQVRGRCSDNAGNSSPPSSHVVRYDSKPPVLRKVTVEAGNGFALLTVTASKDVAMVEVVRSPGLGGAKESVVFRRKALAFKDKKVRNGKRYRYVVTVYDVARNRARRTAMARPQAPLYGPEPGARVSAPPVLEWLPVEKATYYNVQLYRGRTKILSAWPARPRLALTRSWMYEGVVRRLLPGRYTWFVWPGYRGRALTDYGKLIGKSSFVYG
jgi:hypothetical protein